MARKTKMQKANMGDKQVNECLENTIPSYSNGLPPKKRKSKVPVLVIRRSDRLKKSNESRKAEHVNLVELEKGSNRQQASHLPILCGQNLDEESPPVQQCSTMTVVNERKLEEKVDYIVQVVDEFKSKTIEQVSRKQIESLSSEHSYKSLYIDSQRKIEALMEEHYELVRKLEFARGKIDAYERMNTRGASNE